MQNGNVADKRHGNGDEGVLKATASNLQVKDMTESLRYEST